MGIQEKIEKLLKDEAFLAKVEQCDSEEALTALLAQEGVEGDDAKAVVESLAEYWGGEEVTEEDLEKVAGGRMFFHMRMFPGHRFAMHRPLRRPMGWPWNRFGHQPGGHHPGGHQPGGHQPGGPRRF